MNEAPNNLRITLRSHDRKNYVINHHAVTKPWEASAVAEFMAYIACAALTSRPTYWATMASSLGIGHLLVEVEQPIEQEAEK